MELMNTLTLKSPAKLNLYLNVLRKRPDGYHDIETLFERIELCDTIRLQKVPKGIRLTTNHPALPTGSGNLAYRAAELFFKQLRRPSGVRIYLKKKIPIAAGMGGGSSNAATVLLGLNRLYNHPFSQKALFQMGRRLGADVSFFLLQKSFAWGRGRGDLLTPISSRLKILHLVVNPKVMVSTREVYEGFRIGLTKRPSSAKIFQRLLKDADLSGLIDKCYNVLETSVVRKHPPISTVRQQLEALGLQGVTLSGSGPTLFGFTLNLQQARRFREILLSQKDWNVFICKTF